MPPKVLVITGPTATGKTKLGVALAKKFGGEVISADSMQIYKGMDIGTATPTAEEMSGIPHHLISSVDPREKYSAARYVSEASAIADSLIKRGMLPVIVGGTGLYIDSLIASRDFLGGDDALRAELAQRYDAEGSESMHALLARLDPKSADRLHPNDKKRIVRALEVYYATGKTMTDHNTQTQARSVRYDACTIALNYADRKALYQKIDARVDRMMAGGFVREVKTLMDAGLALTGTAMQAIGYKEISMALSGLLSLDEAVEQVKTQTRRYAKRQISWLNGKSDVHWILWENEPDFQKACQCSTIFVENYGII